MKRLNREAKAPLVTIKEIPEFIHRVGGYSSVEHGVAVGAHGPQVRDRIDDVLAADRRYLYEVVNMNESLPDKPIPAREVQIAHLTFQSVVRDAPLACLPIAFVAVHRHAGSRTLWQRV